MWPWTSIFFRFAYRLSLNTNYVKHACINTHTSRALVHNGFLVCDTNTKTVNYTVNYTAMCKKSYANDQSKLENFDDVGLNSLDTGSNVGTEV